MKKRRNETPFSGQSATPFPGQSATPFPGQSATPFSGQSATPFSGHVFSQASSQSEVIEEKSSIRYAPLMPVALLFCLGIWIGTMATPNPMALLFSFIAYSILFLALSKEKRLPIFGLLVVTAGLWRVSVGMEPPSLQLGERSVLCTVQGLVTEQPLPFRWLEQGTADTTSKANPDIFPMSKMASTKPNNAYKNWFVVKTTKFLQPSNVGKSGENTRWVECATRLKVVLANDSCDLFRGDFVEMTGWISTIPSPTNPGQRDLLPYWRSKGVFHTMSIRSRGGVRILQRNQGCPVLNFFSGIRLRCIEILLDVLGPREGALVSALVLGVRRLLDERTNENFRIAGVTHILAISGLHVGIIAIFFHWILSRIGLIRWQCDIMVMAGSLVYSLLTDLDPPVVRSVVMIWVHLVACFVQRRPDSASSLALSALLILWYNPHQLMSAGFQLSFLACACILYVYCPYASFYFVEKEWNLYSGVKWFCHSLKEGLFLSICVCFATAPLIAYHFYLVSPAGPLATMCLIPLVSFVLAATLLLLFSLFGVGWVGSFLGLLLLQSSQWMNGVVEFFASIPGASFYILPPWEPLLALFYLWLLAIIGLHKKPPFFWLVLFSLLVLFSGKIRPCLHCDAKMVALDVGDGSGVYCRLPSGCRILYDCGSMSNGSGTKIFVPFLMEEGVEMLDAIVLSHYDGDHYNALPDILRYVKVGCIVINQKFAQDGERLLEWIRQQKIPILIVKDGEKIPVLPEGTFFYPGERFSYRKQTGVPAISRGQGVPAISRGQGGNEHSLMLMIDYGKSRVLLTGDIGTKAVLQIVSRPFPSVDILQIPHHGRFLSNTAELLCHLRPKIAFVSASFSSSYLQTSDVYASYGVSVHKTFLQGSWEKSF